MNRVATALLATVVGASLMSSAYAADLIIEEPVEVGVVEASGNWDGVFIGVFGGYGWGTVTDDINNILNPSMDIDGWLLGVAAGANFTLTDGIVAGIVGDIAWADISGGIDPFDGVEYSINWLGSVRGKLGFDGGSFLPYLTGGLAFANADETNHGGLGPNNVTHIGWTVGAGVEVAVSDNLSVDLLYRYSDYGSEDYVSDVHGIAPLSLTTNTVSAGLNWQF
jgi:outer membrane immunogenic protein